MITLISWLAVAGVLVAYATGRRPLLDWANAVLFIPVCLPAALAGVWPPVVISVVFGILGVYSIIKRRRSIDV